MIKNQNDTFSPSKIKSKNARVYLATLAEKGMITKLSRGKYKLYQPLFKEYLKTMSGI